MTTYRTPLSQDYDWQLSVSDMVASPAGGEAKGTRYLITVGTGDFTGYSNYIATAKQASPTAPAHWYFDAPLEGMATYVKDEDKCYQYITSWLELRLSCLFDVDRDTGIEVEQSADEDKIHFKTGGTERAILDSTGLGIGVASPTSRLHIQVASTKNVQALLVEQLDTTNNPICSEINNDGTNHGLYIHQDGVLGASRYGLYVYSNVVQINAPLIIFVQDNASSTANILVIENDGTGYGLYIDQYGNGYAAYIYNRGTNKGLAITQAGVLAASQYGLQVYSNAVQINSSLVYFLQDNASSTANVLEIGNDGTGINLYVVQSGNGIAEQIANFGTSHGLFISQDGVLAASKYGLYVYSNAVQVNSYLVTVHQDNASSAFHVMTLINDCPKIGLLISQNGVLGAGVAAFFVDSSAVQVNSPLALFQQGGATSTAPVVEINNDATGHGLYIHQDGVLAASKYGLYVYSNAIQVNSQLAYIQQANASSTVNTLVIDNSGTGSALRINQYGVLAANQCGLYVASGANQISSYLVNFRQAGASSTVAVLELENNGTGQGILIDQYGNGIAQEINNDGTNHGLYVHQDGNLATGKYALYIDNNGTPADGAGRCIRLDGCIVANGTVAVTITSLGPTGAATTIQGWVPVNIDGTIRYMPYW